MKYFLILLSSVFLCSCANEKTLLLPEIEHSEISEIQDVSAAYLFYDETKKDSVELNRKNLISTTNWLVNVDKRLTLKQAIPHIKFLQEKKGNSSHKNEKAKNYFTCNDTSINDLGFIEFTDIVYQDIGIINLIANENKTNNNNIIIYFASLEDIKINTFFEKANIHHSNTHILIKDLKSLINIDNKININLSFNKTMPFQDYIFIKSILLELKTKNGRITNNEFISN